MGYKIIITFEIKTKLVDMLRNNVFYVIYYTETTELCVRYCDGRLQEIAQNVPSVSTQKQLLRMCEFLVVTKTQFIFHHTSRRHTPLYTYSLGKRSLVRETMRDLFRDLGGFPHMPCRLKSFALISIK